MEKERFCALWARCVGDGVGRGGGDARGYAEGVFAELAGLYGEEGRFYHTGGHIEECLARMDAAAGVLGRSEAVELAIWFHDVIYVAGDAENEAKSAEWFVERAEGWLGEALVAEVAGYINCTTHREVPSAAGARFVVDVDLSGMGQAAEFFHRDGENIRKEFAHLSDAEFAKGNGGFLRGLVARERIFATEYFYEKCEARARANIAEALGRYGEMVGG